MQQLGCMASVGPMNCRIGDRKMDKLPTTQAELIPASTDQLESSAPWSKGLGSLLLQDDADGRSDARKSAIRLIAINATLRAETECLLPKLEAAKAPASRDEIIAVVMREMLAWGVPAKHAAEWGVTYASYADALEGLPLYAIEDGVVRWNRAEGHRDLSMGGFPPRPAQLFALANEAKRELFMAAYRAKLALQHVEKQGVEWTPERKRAERAKMIAMGLLTEDGKPAFSIKAKSMPSLAPRVSQHEIAERIRAKASPAPYDDVGVVV